MSKEKIKRFLDSKALKVGTFATSVAMSIPVVAHADVTADAAAITTSLTGGLADTKTLLLSILGITVTAGIGLFAIKFSVMQGVNFFTKLSRKG